MTTPQVTPSDVSRHPMHPEFARQLKIAGVMQEADYYRSRWDGVASYASSPALGVEQALDLVRLLVGVTRSGDRPSGFRAALREADPGFAEDGNTLEMSLLGGFALIHLWSNPNAARAVADSAALAVITWDFRGRAPNEIAFFVAEAKRYRDLRSAALASEVPTPPAFLAVPDMRAAATKAMTAAQQGQFAEFGDPVAQLAEAIRRLGENQLALGTYFDVALRAQREETNVAWWVLGESSRDLGVRVAAIPQCARPLIIGKELADLAPTPPGAFAAEAVIGKMLRVAAATSSESAPHEEITLFEAVSATPRTWRCGRNDVLEGKLLDSLTPALTAVHLSLTTDDETQWVPAFVRAVGFAPETPRRSPAEIAAQVYDEYLLLQAVAAAQVEP